MPIVMVVSDEFAGVARDFIRWCVWGRTMTDQPSLLDRIKAAMGTYDVLKQLDGWTVYRVEDGVVPTGMTILKEAAARDMRSDLNARAVIDAIVGAADEKMVAALEAIPVDLAEMDLDLPDDALPIYGDPRPMSEAPRDGTSILLKYADGHYFFGYFHDDDDGKGWAVTGRGKGAYGDDWYCGWWPLPKGTTCKLRELLRKL